MALLFNDKAVVFSTSSIIIGKNAYRLLAANKRELTQMSAKYNLDRPVFRRSAHLGHGYIPVLLANIERVRSDSNTQ